MNLAKAKYTTRQQICNLISTHLVTRLAKKHGVDKKVARLLTVTALSASTIEPKIGHAKRENRLDRCFLKGVQGDKFNAILAAMEANFRKFLRRLSFLRHFFTWVAA